MITRTPLLRATKVYGQFLGWDFNPLAKLLLLRTSEPIDFRGSMENVTLWIGAFCFGAVIGWCASLSIRVETSFGLSQLSALIGLAVFFFMHRFLAYRPIREFIEKEFSKEI